MNAQRRLSSRKPSVQPHAVDRQTRSAGFTLVELLVVITIIGILAGIAVPAIFSAVSTANSTAMKMELNSLETAVQKYQEKYGDYPPDFSDWAVVERHYRKIFPRISGDLVLLKTLLTDANGYNPTIMDRGEVLAWVLGGYSSDPLRPFTGPGGPLELVGMGGQANDVPVYQINTSKENSLFAFTPGQLDLTIPAKNSPINMSNYHVSSDGDLFLSYAASTKTKTPFVYFDSRTYEYRNPLATSKGFNGFWRPEAGPVRPYISDIVQTDQTWQFMKPNSFQIIAPGIDGRFGWLSKQSGTTGPNDNDTTSAVYYQYPTGKAGQVVIDNNGVRTRVLRNDVSRYQEPTVANQIDNFQRDNLTNFADGKLIDELKE